jgi:hypothetical protein
LLATAYRLAHSERSPISSMRQWHWRWIIDSPYQELFGAVLFRLLKSYIVVFAAEET